ncbi:SAM-dependent methyltransferase [Saccharomonospora sp. NPDC006951]
MAVDGEAPDAPRGIDSRRPNAARVYDWLVGGNAADPVDIEFGEQLLKTFPLTRAGAVMNRRWLWRAVDAALAAGIRQFVDLGSGLPTAGAVHDRVLAAGADQGRVLYVDYEAVARAHIEDKLLADGVDDWCGGAQVDIREPDLLFTHPETRRLIDWDEPVCVLMVAVLHFIGDETDIPALLRRYRERMAPGSWHAISYLSSVDDEEPEQAATLRRLWAAYDDTPNPVFVRDRSEIETWFEGLRMIPPGLVHLPEWGDVELTPELETIKRVGWAGVGEIR